MDEGGREELEERNELEEAGGKGGIINNKKCLKKEKIFMWIYRTLNRVSTSFLAWPLPCYLLALANIREKLRLLASWIKILGMVYVTA